MALRDKAAQFIYDGSPRVVQRWMENRGLIINAAAFRYFARTTESWAPQKVNFTGGLPPSKVAEYNRGIAEYRQAAAPLAVAYREAGLAMAGQNPALARREAEREATRKTINRMAELGSAYRPAKGQEQTQDLRQGTLQLGR